MKCAVEIKGAIGECDEVPKIFSHARALWENRDTDEVGKKVIDLLAPFLECNFVAENVENIEQILSGDSEVDAVEVFLSGFEFTDDDDLPLISATAVFDLAFRDNIDGDYLARWQSETGEDLSFGFNFYWSIDDIEIWLDTHSHTEFWSI